MPIRLAGEGTRELLGTMVARAKAECRAAGLDLHLGEEVQVDSHVVQVRVSRRPSRNGKPTLYAGLWLDGRKRGFNHVRGVLDGAGRVTATSVAEECPHWQ